MAALVLVTRRRGPSPSVGSRPGPSRSAWPSCVSSPCIYSIYIILAARLAASGRGETAASRTGGAGAETRPAVASALMITATFAMVAILAVVTGEPVLPGDVPSDAWFGLAGIAVFSTALAISAFYASTARIGAAQTALSPPWTV